MRTRNIQILGVALLALPLIIFPGVGDEIRVPKQFAMFLLAALFFGKVLWEKIAPEFGVFYCFISVSAVVTGFGYPYQMHELCCVTAAMALGLVVARPSQHSIKFLMNMVLWGALINAAYGYIQMSGYDPIFLYKEQYKVGVPIGFLGQQTLFGPYMAVGAAIALFNGSIAQALFFIPVIYKTGSSFTYASLGASVFLWLVYKFGIKRVAFIPTISALVIGVLNRMGNELMNPQRRLEVWSRIYEKTMRDHPLMGHGFGTYIYYAGNYQTDHERNMDGIFQQAHSDPVQLFHDCGLIGVLLALVVLFYFAKQAIKFWHVREIACAATVAVVILVNSFGNFPLRLVPQGLICLLCVIMVSSYKRSGEFA